MILNWDVRLVGELAHRTNRRHSREITKRPTRERLRFSCHGKARGWQYRAPIRFNSNSIVNQPHRAQMASLDVRCKAAGQWNATNHLADE